MEMWKTAAYADGKPIHSLMEKDEPFPQVCKQVSHSNAGSGSLHTFPQRLLLRISILSLPIQHKKTGKTGQKKSGSTAIGQTEKLYSFFNQILKAEETPISIYYLSLVSHALSTEIANPTKEIPQPTKEISLLIPLAEIEIPNKITAIPTKILVIAFIQSHSFVKVSVRDKYWCV